MKTRKELYQEICTKLEPLVTSGALKFVDLNKGQLSRPDKTYPITFPSVLIQTDAVRYSHMVENRVEGDATVTLIIAFNNYNESFVGAANKQDSENLLDLLDSIIEAMIYTRGDNFTDMHLSQEQFLPYTFNGLNVHQITFTTNTYHKLKENATIRITSGA
mgnify:FL=1